MVIYMKNILSFIRLPLKIKKILLEASVALLLAKILISFTKLKSITKLLGKSNRVTRGADTDIDLLKVSEVSYSVQTMSRFTPWESNCLVQACAAKYMLNRRNQPGTVYFGLAKDEKGSIIAHAWVKCGKHFVTGGDGSTHFITTGSFS